MIDPDVNLTPSTPSTPFALASLFHQHILTLPEADCEHYLMYLVQADASNDDVGGRWGDRAGRVGLIVRLEVWEIWC